MAVAVSKSSDRDRNSTPARCRPSITYSPWVSPLESRSMWVTTRVSPSTTRSSSAMVEKYTGWGTSLARRVGENEVKRTGALHQKSVS